ncbi:hypothetical protein KL911_000258 [Ogataea haglerorum]|uniref:uncharacterized protein n=1 Tax=Ogataea haglerorum TaxID=1937702 RepID=UPI001C89EB68|nr:uncharacterized protein KL911_000258 [Ogataea haglerorum]KAG7759121.1 hypothetical protein KL911_000258 [Ogataea haglerorum]
MASAFLGVYVALYDYQAQNDEELSIQENDLLYLLEKSDIDDWWKVKKRVVDADVEEPSGLVPSTYIEPAKVIGRATALYDYDKQTEEELTFTEGAQFDVYDTSDQNWTLVGLNGHQFGFVPANYIEMGQAQQPASQAPQQSVYGTGSALKDFPPPPQRADLREERGPPLESPAPQMPARPNLADSAHSPDEEAPPPMPSRPRSSTVNSRRSVTSDAYAESRESDGLSATQDNNAFLKDDFFTWTVYEIDGRKKKKATFAIGNSTIFITPSGSSDSRDWSINDLISYSHEKKHVFLDFKNPSASYELHAGTKDSAEAIVSILGDLKGMASMSVLKDVKEASIPSTKKQGKIIYDFEAASPDELTCFEGDTVNIINDKKSKDWWMVQNIETGEQGVVPSNYVKVISSGSAASAGLRSLFSRKGSSSSLSPKKKRIEKERKKEAERELALEREELERQRRRQQRKERELRDRAERERIRKADEKEREKRAKSASKHKDSSKPNPYRVRTWIDRSGAFKVEAEFLGCSDGKIHLHKVNGVKIAVAAQKLSVEDLEFVERITGMSLESYKDKKPLPAERPESAPAVVATPEKPKSSALPSNEKLYEFWFDFFVTCGVDANVCDKYARNFTTEQMDEAIMADIDTSLMRTLGLKEGDILRVNKYLDNKFNRKPEPISTQPTNGGLFSTNDGSLKTNKANASTDSVNGQTLKQQFEDDAWSLKPAAKTGESKPVTPQLTGSIQDLVKIKPMEPTKSGPIDSSASAPALQKPALTGSTSTLPAVTSQKTSGTLNPQLTAMQTGALMAMPTGFMPITMVPMLTGQATGLIPLQPTGKIMPATTFAQKTGGTMPATTFAQKTGGFMPVTTFGSFAQPQPTGGLVPLQPTGLVINKTGGLQRTGGNLVPLQTSFPAMQATMRTGGLMGQPTGMFGQQTGMQGGVVGSQTGFQNGSLGQPAGFQSGYQPGFQTNIQPTFQTGLQTGAQTTLQTGFQNGLTGQRTGFVPQSQFGMNQLSNMFAQTSLGGPTGTNNMNTGMNMNTMNTGFNTTSNPAASFNTGTNINGMNQFPATSFNSSFNEPLTSQPTGLGFGNAPSTSFGPQSQPTGKRANLANATADNPFGF